MPFLLLDDATEFARQRLQDYGNGVLQALQPPPPPQLPDPSDITQRLQDFGAQHLSDLLQALPDSSGLLPPPDASTPFGRVVGGQPIGTLSPQEQAQALMQWNQGYEQARAAATENLTGNTPVLSGAASLATDPEQILALAGGGALGQAALPGGGALANIGRQAIAGGLAGGTYGAEQPSASAEDILGGAALGAGLGAAGGGVAQVVSPLAGRALGTAAEDAATAFRAPVTSDQTAELAARVQQYPEDVQSGLRNFVDTQTQAGTPLEDIHATVRQWLDENPLTAETAPAAAQGLPRGVTQDLVDAAHQRIEGLTGLADPDGAHAQLDALLAAGASPAEVARFFADLGGQTVSATDVLRSLRTGSMAGGVGTELKVAASPIIQTAMRAPVGALNLLLQGRPEAIPAGLQGGLAGLAEGARDALQTLRYGINYRAALSGGAQGGYGFAPGLDVLGASPLTRGVGTALTGLVRTHGAVSDISAGIGRRANLALGATPAEAAEAGQQWALRSGDYGTVGSAVADALGQLRGRNPALDVVGQLLVPFYRVGYNVFTQGLERSPLGLAGRITDALQGKPLDQGKLLNNLFGVGLASLAFGQAAAGNITGERPAGGAPRQSVRVAGDWIPLRALGPASEPLAQAAALYESARDNQGNVGGLAGQFASEYVKHVADETWLSSLADAMDTIGALGNVSSANASARGQAQRELGYQVGQYGKSFIPQEKLGEQVLGALGAGGRGPVPTRAPLPSGPRPPLPSVERLSFDQGPRAPLPVRTVTATASDSATLEGLRALLAQAVQTGQRAWAMQLQAAIEALERQLPEQPVSW